MELVRLNLATKNNLRNGFYLYTPIVKINTNYFFCESIKSEQPLKKDLVSISSLMVKRQIPNQFLAANGIN